MRWKQTQHADSASHKSTVDIKMSPWMVLREHLEHMVVEYAEKNSLLSSLSFFLVLFKAKKLFGSYFMKNFK